MPFDLKHFAKRGTSCYLYHLTAASNVDRIRWAKRLESTAALLRAAGRPELLAKRRQHHEIVVVDGLEISLRDQAVLHEGNIAFDDGWCLADVVALLNARVYFWPGSADGPSDYGKRHHARYEAERPAVIRVPTRSLFDTNRDNPAQFCRFNSGAPRCSGGNRSPRGANTFQTSDAAAYSAGDVVEVTFLDGVHLPADTEVRGPDHAAWEMLLA